MRVEGKAFAMLDKAIDELVRNRPAIGRCDVISNR
jgi:hypothetical protein